MLGELERIQRSGVCVVVEGIKDKRALAQFGIVNVITLKKPLFAVVEQLCSESEVVVLTDLDVKGRELYHKLSEGLKRCGVKVNDKIRTLLFKTPLRQIEGLSSFVRKSQARR